MANARCRELFRECIALAMENWTALQLALDHGMGGQNGFVKARQLPDLLVTMFSHDGSVSAENISDELFDFMDTHMDTECEDGSCEELGTILWNLFQLCKSGNQTALEKELHKLALTRHHKRKESSREFTYCEAMTQDAGPLRSITEDSHDEVDSGVRHMAMTQDAGPVKSTAEGSREEVDSGVRHMEEDVQTLDGAERVPVEEEKSDWTEVTRRRKKR